MLYHRENVLENEVYYDSSANPPHLMIEDAI